MFSESEVTEICCMADDFCEGFTLQQKKYMVADKKPQHCKNPNRMSDAEIMTILIQFRSAGFRCFKHYYMGHMYKHLKRKFLRLVLYSRFVGLEKEVLLPLAVF